MIISLSLSFSPAPSQQPANTDNESSNGMGIIERQSNWWMMALPVLRYCWLLFSFHHADPEMSSDPGIKERIQTDYRRENSLEVNYSHSV